MNNYYCFKKVKVPIFEYPFECRQFLQHTDYLNHNRCLHLHLHHRYLHLVQTNPHRFHSSIATAVKNEMNKYELESGNYLNLPCVHYNSQSTALLTR